MDTSFATTRLLYEQARREAIGKVFDEQLYQHPIALDLNDTGLEDLMPRTQPIHPKHDDGSLDAILAFGDVDRQVLDHACGFLEQDGLFCYLADTAPVDLIQFYQWPQPIPYEHFDEINEWLDSIGFSVLRQGTRQATQSVFARDAPVTLEHQDVPMYELAEGALIVASVSYTLSQLR